MTGILKNCPTLDIKIPEKALVAAQKILEEFLWRSKSIFLFHQKNRKFYARLIRAP